MNEQHEEVNGVKVCDWCVETGGKRPRQGHQQITAGVDFSKTSEVRMSGGRTDSWGAVTFPTNRK